VEGRRYAHLAQFVAPHRWTVNQPCVDIAMGSGGDVSRATLVPPQARRPCEPHHKWRHCWSRKYEAELRKVNDDAVSCLVKKLEAEQTRFAPAVPPVEQGRVRARRGASSFSVSGFAAARFPRRRQTRVLPQEAPVPTGDSPVNPGAAEFVPAAVSPTNSPTSPNGFCGP